MNGPFHAQEFTAFAGQLADASGAIIRDAARGAPIVEAKGDNSPVTLIDKAVEDRLRAMIEEKHPGHGIIGEERGVSAPDEELKWVIDPIDGTLPFLAGFPVFGTLIALVHGEVPVLGIIDMPVTGERWMGGEGMATTWNGEPVSTRACENLSDALMSTSNPDFYSGDDRPALDRMRAATRWRVYGGSCMAYGRIAEGRIDVGIDVNYDIHDFLALVPVIAGAGGVITDWDGEPLDINSGGRFIASGDMRVHEQAMKLLTIG